MHSLISRDAQIFIARNLHLKAIEISTDFEISNLAYCILILLTAKRTITGFMLQKFVQQISNRLYEISRSCGPFSRSNKNNFQRDKLICQWDKLNCKINKFNHQNL